MPPFPEAMRRFFGGSRYRISGGQLCGYVGVSFVKSDITSNKPFEEWSEMMGDEIMTTALLDRLLHHAQVFSLQGDSYRIKKRKKE